MRILTVNPGSTSTKVAVFDNQKRIAKATIKHETTALLQLDALVDQIPLRLGVIEAFLGEYNIPLSSIDGFIGRGGLLKPLESGLYEVNDVMIETLSTNRYGVHASNLGGLLAHALADKVNKKAYIADPVVVDEMSATAKFSGLNGISRRSLFHALNQKAVARRYAEETGTPYEAMRLIVAHLGGGISVGYHLNGRVVDVNNALDGDGPMSPERSGSLPVCSIIDLAFSGQYTQEELLKTVRAYGGMFSYLNTKDAEAVSDMINQGSVEAKKVFKAMVYQMAKSIGALYGVSEGKIDAIIVTGGLAYNADIVEPLKQKIAHMGHVIVYPGENELESLAFNMQAFLESKTPAKYYQES